MAMIFPRTALAAQMATQLLRPSVLDTGLRSGLFLSGVRRTGKTTFLRNDLIPALEAQGAVVVYVDLWSDIQANPMQLVHDAVRHTLEGLQTPGSRLLQRVRDLRGGELDLLGIKFGFALETVGMPGGATLADAMTAVVETAKTDVVLVIDEVQHAITTEEGRQLLFALKAARDAINPRPDVPGHFLFIGTGSHRAMVSELTMRRNQAFNGAISLPYPLLDQDYVVFLLQRLAEAGISPLPTVATAVRAFKTLGCRPEEMIRAVSQLITRHAHEDAEQVFPVIAQTLRSSAADVELAKVEGLGGLAQAIFDRVARTDGPARGIFSAEATAAYSRQLGRVVRVEEIQPIANELLAENLIMRSGHGIYAVTDPFVQEMWRERQQLLNAFA